MELQIFNVKSEYRAALKEVVMQAVSPRDAMKCCEQFLFQIIEQSKGAYPVDVVSTLNALGICYREDDKAYRINAANADRITCAVQDSLFADPHPADYDWRFNKQSIWMLTKKLLSTAQGGRIALLGTKTLFAPLYDQGAEVTLFNKSNSILNDLRAAGYLNGLVECDLSLPLAAGNGSYQVVLADPPWYVDYYGAFLRRAADLLCVGGTVYLSVLPVLTRPGAEEDRVAILEMATALGLQLVQQDAGGLSYETPGFEHQALLACGLYCGDWRRGDLWIFRKQYEGGVNLTDGLIIGEPNWIEYRIGSKRIKLRLADVLEAARFTYNAVDPKGAVMTHVSRRSPFRNKIDVWSSDNHAYTVTRISVLQECLGQLEADRSFSEVVAALVAHQNLDQEERRDLIALLTEFVQ
jgi:hypothetical protein